MMVEDINAADSPTGYTPVEASKTGIAGFAASKRGRIVLGSVGAVVLLGVLVSVLYMFVLQPTDVASEETLVPPAGAVAQNSNAVPVSEEASATEPESKPLSSTFAFRDIFEPTRKPSVVPSSTADEDGTTDTDGTTGTGTTGTDGTGGTDTDGTDTADVPEDTLLLKSVSTVDGEPTATFVWNGQTYTAGEGEQLGDTPWEVVDISGNTVVMLYGDSRVTLTVGQGISK